MPLIVMIMGDERGAGSEFRDYITDNQPRDSKACGILCRLCWSVSIYVSYAGGRQFPVHDIHSEIES
jgi:hypothetical protein